MSLSQKSTSSHPAGHAPEVPTVAPGSWPHLVVLRRGGARPPLVLISGVEGHGFGFRHLAKLFDEDQPLLALQLIGIDLDEPTDCRIEDMAAVFEVQVRAACPRGPILVGGYSMGAAVAFELAHRLRKHGREVPLLVSIDGFAPGYHRTLIPARVHVLRQIRIALGHERTEKLKTLRRRALSRLPNRFRGASAREPEHDARKIALAVFRYRAVMQYKTTATLPIALLLIRATRHDHLPAPCAFDPLYGWGRFIDGPIRAETVEGAHLTFLESDDANRAIVRHITARIQEVISSILAPDSGVIRSETGTFRVNGG